MFGRSGGSSAASEPSNLSRGLSRASDIPSDDEDDDTPSYPRPVDLFSEDKEQQDLAVYQHTPKPSEQGYGPHGLSPLAPTSANLRQLGSSQNDGTPPVQSFLAAAEQGSPLRLPEGHAQENPPNSPVQGADQAAYSRDPAMSASFAAWHVPKGAAAPVNALLFHCSYFGQGIQKGHPNMIGSEMCAACTIQGAFFNWQAACDDEKSCSS